MGLPRTTGEGGVPPLRLSHTHDMVINWLLLNPEKSLRECAAEFGYTQSWLSTLIHSDLFQVALKQRQMEVASRVAASIPAKLAAVADVALDKLGEMIEKSEDPEFILDAADKALHRMGYAPQSSRNPAGSPASTSLVQNNLFVNATDLREAREMMGQLASTPVIEVEVLPADEGLGEGVGRAGTDLDAS